MGPARQLVEGIGAHLQLAADRLIEPPRPGPRSSRFAAGIHDEVAVRAMGHAERKMEVQRDRRLWSAHRQRVARSSRPHTTRGHSAAP